MEWQWQCAVEDEDEDTRVSGIIDDALMCCRYVRQFSDAGDWAMCRVVKWQ